MSSFIEREQFCPQDLMRKATAQCPHCPVGMCSDLHCRIITKAWSASGEALWSELQCTLASRKGFQKLVLCRRILMGGSIIPSSFFHMHQRPSCSHHNSTPLFSPLLRTKQHFSSFRYSVVPLWNCIPEVSPFLCQLWLSNATSDFT